MSSVHPSAIGSETQPNTDSISQVSSTSSVDASSTTATVGSNDDVYPEQHHAGKVGYGPNYHQGPTLGDKLKGLEEELKGKITRDRALVEHGRERITGELKAKEREEDLNKDPFATPEDKQQHPEPGQASAGHAQGVTQTQSQGHAPRIKHTG
ncbi:hypothetical protein D9615_005421 [Tricholomella constricta]|uniref:Uncharacterized protein n=1 Tax=Tricholomella constricta TaxID=117010 RepID=A0A8H5HE51_9AGAR|nr:hypothetical protein D9615_005421 [Tricholomella constricta]